MNSSTSLCFAQRCFLSHSTQPAPWPATRLVARRALSTTNTLHSGHNRWSKIKHDKARVDAGVSKQRSYISREITVAVKVGGADTATNLRLTAILAEAKRTSFPKAHVERAIMRGEGKSTSGLPLEAITVEFMLPPAVGGILELETDNRRRTMQKVKEILRDHGAALSPSAYMFDRRGRLVWPAAEGRTEDMVLESAIEAGALDVETVTVEEEEGAGAAADAEGRRPQEEFVVWTEVADMATVAEQLTKALDAAPKSQELTYKAKEDVVVESGGDELEMMMAKFDDLSDVQDVYVNLAY